jgi:hypothetical protein
MTRMIRTRELRVVVRFAWNVVHAAMLEWLDSANLPTGPHELSPGRKVPTPDNFYRALRIALSRGPGGRRSQATIGDARRPKQIVDGVQDVAS